MTFDYVIELAEKGDTDAMVKAIQEFVWNEHIVIEDTPTIRAKTVEYLNKAIFSGNVEAMNQLGAMYAEGRWVERDFKQAFLFYKMASEHGDALATSNLGFCYYYGNGTEQNYEEAYKAFSKAALLNIGDAYVRLGDMFQKGYYVTKDEKTAVALYEKGVSWANSDLSDWGCQQVYSDANLRLGDCYFRGCGINKDIPGAIEHLAIAVHYYDIREKKGDSYSSKGYLDAKEKLKEAMNAL